MRSIAVINQKGGVGKTTTAVNLGAALAAAGQKVCVVDLDPQAHASLHLNVICDGQERLSVYHSLAGDMPLAEIRLQINDNLWLVAADIDLAAVEIELAGVPDRELILRRRIEADTAEFDYLIIDCPPSLGVLTLNALSAVDEVLIPLQPHFLALHGLSKLLDTIQWVAGRTNPSLKLSGVVLCMYEANTKLATEVARDVDEFFTMARGTEGPWSQAKSLTARIRRNIRLAEAPSFGQSILEYAPDSHGADDYRQLAHEVHALHEATALLPLEMPVVPQRRAAKAAVA